MRRSVHFKEAWSPTSHCEEQQVKQQNRVCLTPQRHEPATGRFPLEPRSCQGARGHAWKFRADSLSPPSSEIDENSLTPQSVQRNRDSLSERSSASRSAVPAFQLFQVPPFEREEEATLTDASSDAGDGKCIAVGLGVSTRFLRARL